jgi:uncharacterized protein YlxP (DUF503 family)
MVIGVLRLGLHLEGVESLKDKRSVVRRVLGRCRSRFPVSAAEVDDQDSRGSAVLGFVMVSSSEKVIAPVLDRIERHVETLGLAEIISVDIEFIHCQGG